MNTYEYQRLRGLKRKLYLIEQRGGCCEQCGYNKNIAAFDFHHKDPSKKNFKLDIRKLGNISMKKLLFEFEKCELLCANCHREKHSPDLEVSNVRTLTEQIPTNVFGIVDKKIVNCLDCDVVLKYNSVRCRHCTNINKRKVERPDLGVLQLELKEHGVTWCSKKYGVSRKSIHRWLDRQIQ